MLSPLEFVRRRRIARLLNGQAAANGQAASNGQARDSARVVCVASGKGGTGKSVLATNLAACRARAGDRVLLVDFDAGLANAHLLLGLAPRYDLGHLIEGMAALEHAVVEGPHGLHLVSGGVGRAALAQPTKRELERLFLALRPAEERYDLIVIDHGAGMSYGTIAHLAATSTLLLVTSHEITGLSDAYALYKRALMVNAHIRVGMVVNRAPTREAAESARERFRSASQRFLASHPEWIGWVQADEAVARSIEARVPVTLAEPESPAARALLEVARWSALEHARTSSPFYERALRAL
jgi:flagellar biosynthesis protein FlhG